VAPVILLDTHVVAWLYAGETGRFPDSVVRRLEAEDDLAVSPLVALELQYLHEIGRTSQPADTVLTALGRTLGLRTADCSLAELIGHAIAFDWTRDPFDRLLAAHATAEHVPLLTADRRIRDHLRLAVWDG
jgi:PIN domain nuclease of toxin-antitoxin system